MAQNKLPIYPRAKRLEVNRSPLGVLPERKKILFLITKATWGGAQRYVFDLATHLPENEFEVVVAYGASGKLLQDLKTASIETYELPSLGRDVAIISDIKSFFAILKCIRTIQPDVIHLNSSKAAALGALAARLAGVKKIIFTVHGWPFNEKRNEFARVMMYIISWFTAFVSHTVIVVSKSDEAQGKRMRWMSGKVRYIPIGIKPPLFLSREEASTFLALTSNGLRVGTIAELTPNKGLRYAIEAIALLEEQGVDVSYSIIGDGEQRAELKDIAVKFDVIDRVTFHGSIPDAAKYLRAFDVFLLPSTKEGMPYVLLEAALADLPIVTTSVIDPEFVHRYPFIRLIEPASSEEIAGALKNAPRTRPQYQDYPTLDNMITSTIALY